MNAKENTPPGLKYFNYYFKCPTLSMNGQIKFFPSPVDETHCFVCKRQKGTGDNQCDYEIKGG